MIVVCSNAPSPQCVAFMDISPQAPVHFLVVPRKPIVTLDDATDADQEVRLQILMMDVCC